MEIPAIVKHIIFRSESGFGVISCELDRFSDKYTLSMEEQVRPYVNEKYGTFVVITTMLVPNEDPKGGQYIFVGDFVNDPKRGPQFKSEFYYQDVPTTEDGLKAFLISLPNIREARSAAIIQKFGVEGVVAILDVDIHRLTEIAGINEKRLPAIQKAWNEKKYLRELYNFFTKYRISPAMADKVYKQWANDAIRIVSDTPYRLVEIRGVGFIKADEIAHKICPTINDEQRVTACMRYVLEDFLNKESSLCAPYRSFKEKTIATLLACDENLSKKTNGKVYLKLMPECLKNNLNLFTLVKDLETNEGYVYLAWVWEKEYYIAKSLWDRKVFNHAAKDCTDNDIGGEEAKLEIFSGKKVKLDDSQKEAVKSSFGHKVSIITGPGGSGKSTICRCICSLAHKKGLKVRLMSPTGKAAQVLKDKTGCDASTIHRSLKMTPEETLPRADITEDILIVDEISMSGLDTMFALMAAMDDNLWGNIVFVGDKNQLPSVSPGNFLSDIIDSGCANVVTLDKIHRVDEKSFISLLANDISKGKVVEVPKGATDIRWHELRSDTFQTNLIEFVDGYLKSGHNIEDLQIISPMKKGECGVYKINSSMQQKMAMVNGTEDENIQIGFNKYHVGDRVIQLENNYDKMVFNGDMGVIVDLGEKIIDSSASDKKEQFVTVQFIEDKLTYFGTEIEQFQLAWAITVHKFQGSSSKNVIFVMANEAQIMMSKELVYTAFTRAEKQLDVFGNDGMLKMAPTRSSVRKRFTNLKRIIEEFRTNRKILKVLKK